MKDILKNGLLKDYLNHKLMLSYWHTPATYIRVDLETLLQRICSKGEKLIKYNSVCKNGGEGRIKHDLSCSQA